MGRRHFAGVCAETRRCGVAASGAECSRILPGRTRAWRRGCVGGFAARLEGCVKAAPPRRRDPLQWCGPRWVAFDGWVIADAPGPSAVSRDEKMARVSATAHCPRARTDPTGSRMHIDPKPGARAGRPRRGVAISPMLRRALPRAARFGASARRQELTVRERQRALESSGLRCA